MQVAPSLPRKRGKELMKCDQIPRTLIYRFIQEFDTGYASCEVKWKIGFASCPP
jgi:hypothetical protein